MGTVPDLERPEGKLLSPGAGERVLRRVGSALRALDTLGPGRRRALLWACLAAVLAQALVTAPFVRQIDTLVRHWDGPNYLVVAKTFYVPTAESPLPGHVGSARYFAVHLPLYPAAVRLLSGFVGYRYGLLGATLLFGVLSAVAFVLYVRQTAPQVWLPAGLAAFLSLPGRALLYRSIGAAEGAMTLFVLLALLAYRRERYGLAYLAASLSMLTRINGVFVTGAISLALLARGRFREALLGAGLATLPLLALFGWYGVALGDPLAYFHTNVGALSPPFSFLPVKLRSDQWESAELSMMVFLLLGLSAARLWSQGWRVEAGLLALHVALFSMPTPGNDLVRYAVPLLGPALVVAWKELWSDRVAASMVLAFLVPLSVYYAWESVPVNLCHPFAYEHLLRLLAER